MERLSIKCDCMVAMLYLLLRFHEPTTVSMLYLERQTDRQAERQIDRQAERQTDRQAERQIDRDRQREGKR